MLDRRFIRPAVEIDPPQRIVHIRQSGEICSPAAHISRLDRGPRYAPPSGTPVLSAPALVIQIDRLAVSLNGSLVIARPSYCTGEHPRRFVARRFLQDRFHLLAGRVVRPAAASIAPSSAAPPQTCRQSRSPSPASNALRPCDPPRAATWPGSSAIEPIVAARPIVLHPAIASAPPLGHIGVRHGLERPQVARFHPQRFFRPLNHPASLPAGCGNASCTAISRPAPASATPRSSFAVAPLPPSPARSSSAG